MDATELAIRIALALLAGTAVGINRDLFGKPTGVRLHALVAVGSAVAVLCGLESDPTSGASRVIQGIVGGIGFLGAGVIMHGAAMVDPADRKSRLHRFDIQHMTTAAAIWLTAALGIAAGLGHWRLLVLATLAAVIILVVGLPIDRALFGRFRESEDDQAE
jgi:putative Mg2+ transporter-C (MgtC) family protein